MQRRLVHTKTGCILTVNQAKGNTFAMYSILLSIKTVSGYLGDRVLVCSGVLASKLCENRLNSYKKKPFFGI